MCVCVCVSVCVCVCARACVRACVRVVFVCESGGYVIEVPSQKSCLLCSNDIIGAQPTYTVLE